MLIMHATGGGLCGQVFALASSNESGEKKSRIRRSKEERKTLVESFIKLYQKSNNGNFPSLRLTHKEVGGSFYTVREIVREVIQENRVLAPPKVSLVEHVDENTELLDQQLPASISMDPQIMSEETISSSASSIQGSSALYLNNELFQDESMQVVSNGEPFLRTQSGEFANHRTPNGGAMVLDENQDSDKQETSFNGNDKLGSQTHERLEVLDTVEVPRSQLHFDVVETFPLHPISGNNANLLEEDRTVREESIMLDRSTSSINSDNDEPHSNLVKEFSGKVEDGKIMQKPQHKFHESTKGYVASDVKVNTSSSGISSSYNGINQLDNGNSYSLDRINLETWEESSGNKTTHSQSENTFVGLLKAFFTAFSKFWSE